MMTALRRAASALVCFALTATFVLVVPTGAQAASPFVVTSTGDGADSNTADGVCNNGAGACTLRAAMEQANASAGADSIQFNIPGGPPFTIAPATDLPFITGSVTIDGTTQPGYSASPIIEVSGINVASGQQVGFWTFGGTNTFRGLSVIRWATLGMFLDSGVSTVEASYIGLNSAGVAAPNALGIQVGGIGHTIGGTAPGAGNVISGNANKGIWIRQDQGGSGTIVQGNLIGTDPTGTAAIPNASAGLDITDSVNNVVGGSSPAARNVISGNNGTGVFVWGAATGNTIAGNYIGVDVTGTVDLGNTGRGIELNRAANNTIGGTAPGAGNVVSGNNAEAIGVFNASASGNVIQGNLIGTNAAGTGAVGNSNGGIVVLSGPSNTTIGGTTAGAGNTIAYNGGGPGVWLESGTGNGILGNSIHSNNGIGISFSGAGATPNDLNDPDTGANNKQNFPIVTSTSSTGGTTTVSGSLNSTASTSFRLEFFSSPTCDPSGYGEGKVFLGSDTVLTDGTGNVSFTSILSAGVPAGHVVTATATAPGNNTSEFSACTSFHGTTERVSVSSSGNQGNGWSGGRAISSDGRFVAFESETSNLVPGDTNNTGDVFVRDRQTGITERVSVDSSGNESNGYSQNPSISDDGRYVAFESFSATNLVPADTNNRADVFVHDRQTGQTVRASLGDLGVQGNNDSTWASISADGRFVAFSSDASNLVSGDTNANTDAFVRDLLLGTTQRVSVNSSGTQGNDFSGGQGHMEISGDGNVVAFISHATNLVPGDTNGVYDVFTHNRATGITERVSVDSSGNQSNADSYAARVDYDGTVVGFTTTATNLVPGDTNGFQDSFVHDSVSGTTERVSLSNLGGQLGGASNGSSMSSDGRYVAYSFGSGAYVRDRVAGATDLVSVDSAGNAGNGSSSAPSLSDDGRFAVFASTATNLVAGDTNGQSDVFVHERQAPPPDTTAPETTIDTGPSGTVGSTSADFTFHANETSTFACQLDGGGFSPCNSGSKSYVGLAGTSHTFEVRATDGAGNPDATPASRTWSIDTTAPETTIDARPSDPSSDPTGDFTFSSEPGATFQCKVDAGSYGACSGSGGHTTSSLVDGSHTFYARACDALNNCDATPASYTWTTDTTAPETTIATVLGGTVTTRDVSISFSSEAGATFECKLDSGSWGACSSPKGYAGLVDGSHIFYVRATDAVGNTDATPATRTWTIDATAPDTSIDSGPAGTVASSSAAFSFSSEPGATFFCQLDSSSWGACSSPKSYTSLSDVPTHTFRVRAKDAAGNTDATPATRTFTVDTTPPQTTIGSGPSGTVATSGAAFTFASSEAASSFSCMLDSGSWGSCTSPESYSGLPDGSHTFYVVAKDAVDNVDPTPASRTWTIDTTPLDTTAPETTITSGPSGTQTISSAVFYFSSSEPGSTFKCSVDGATFSTCNSPVSLSGLAAVSHTFEVEATDAANNTDQTPASRTWIVDLTPPGTYQPDLLIKLNSDHDFIGDGIYNLTGENQSVTKESAPPSTMVFDVRLENDGSATDTFTLGATDVSSRFTVSFSRGGTDITSKLLVDEYSVTLGAGESVDLVVKLKSERTGDEYLGSSLITATSTKDPSKADAVSSSNRAKTAAGVGGAHRPLLGPLGPAPGNDDFADATALSGASITQGPDSNVSATKQASEPDHAANPGGASVWYSWTAPSDGAVVVDTSGSSFDTLLGVYTGPSVDSLTEVAAGNDDSAFGLQSKVSFAATSGETYMIAVDGYVGETGSISLHLELAAAPANDDFADATSLSGAEVVLSSQSNDSATKQTGEPNIGTNPGGASVWYSWTAPSDGVAEVKVTGNQFCDVLGVYTGSAVGSLTEVASHDGCGLSRVSFAATSGTTYMIAVDGEYGASGGFGVHAKLKASSFNDDFADATVLSGTDITRGPDDNLAASKESGEPDHAANPGGASVWYSWSAPSDGTAVVDTSGSDFDTLLGVYTGPSVGSLVEVASADDHSAGLSSEVTFAVTSGETYMIAVDGYSGETGDLELRLRHYAQPETSIDTGPSGTVASGDVSFTFSATPGAGTSVAGFECRLDGGWGTCSSAKSYSLGHGDYVFKVRAIDSVGNTDPTPATRAFSVDTTPPQTTIDSGPSGIASSNSADFTFHADETSTFACQIDSGGFSPCNSGSRSYSGLSGGSHTFYVRATDGVGNTDPTPASRTWTVPSSFALAVAKAGAGTGRVTDPSGNIYCGVYCTWNVAPGTLVTLSASPAAGSYFAGWSGAGCSGTAPCTVTTTSAKTVTATFGLNTLAVTKAGTGAGRVSDPSGNIYCGVYCTWDVAPGTVMTLSAYPNSVSAFTGWSGGGCTGTGTCTVTVDASKSVTATFDAIPVVTLHKLTVAKTGSGAGRIADPSGNIWCGVYCTWSVSPGTSITLSASPAAGSYFAGWSGGGCTGTAPCTVTMSSAQTVTATFGLNTLTVAKTGIGAGRVTDPSGNIYCGVYCTWDVAPGTLVTLSASPAAGSYFAGWSGGGCSGVAPCTVNVTASPTVTATFTFGVNTLTVAKAGSGAGRVTDPSGNIYCGTYCTWDLSPGTLVTLSASPAAGSYFAGWSGGGCTGTAPCTVNVTASPTVTATFEVNVLTVAKAGTGVGRVTDPSGNIYCGTYCSWSVSPGTLVTLTAAPAAGSTFAGWSGGGCSGVALMCIVTVDASKTVSATFT